MTIDWQDAMALVAAATAGGYLLWRVWLALRRKRAACGGCSNCTAAADTKTIVTIDLR
ncbi:MAG TPA: hypothetical protein VJ809_13805 [Pirellulales bacterium]|jgi:hypothetical protein|nr:hypothetical protein [Pirellulales bacterium]